MKINAWPVVLPRRFADFVHQVDCDVLVLALVDGLQNLWVYSFEWVPCVASKCVFNVSTSRPSLFHLASIRACLNHVPPPSSFHSVYIQYVTLAPTVFPLRDFVRSLFGRGILNLQTRVLFPCVFVQEYQMASCATPQVPLDHDGAFVMALTSRLAKE